MTCIHGLDQANCPVCRIENAMVPPNAKEIKDLYKNPLKPKSPYLDEGQENREKIEKELKLKRLSVNKDKFIVPRVPLSLNTLPDFKNQMFIKRMKEIDITKSEDFKIPKKKSLESPEWQFKSD